MKDYLVLRVVSKFLIPFIFMYALYVQMHGEYSPGGGFQAGVIMAAGFILYALIYGLASAMRIISINTLKIYACCGVLLYASVGIITMLRGDKFLAYSSLASHAVKGQQWGIFVIELGVGITVFSVMLLLFFTFANRAE